MPQVMVPTSSKNTRKFIMRALLAMAAIIVAAVVLLALRWPFRRAAVLKQLEDASLSKVDAGASTRRTSRALAVLSNMSPFNTIQKL